MSSSLSIGPIDRIDAEELGHLYESVGWAAYTRDPTALTSAVANSTYCLVARVAGDLGVTTGDVVPGWMV